MKRKVHYTNLLSHLNFNPVKSFSLFGKLRLLMMGTVLSSRFLHFKSTGHSNKKLFKYEKLKHCKMKIRSI